MFAVLLVNVNYLQAFQADSLTSKPSNVRAFEQQFKQQRGQIVAADGTVMAKSVATSNAIYKDQRVYTHGTLYAPVTGYASTYAPAWPRLTSRSHETHLPGAAVKIVTSSALFSSGGYPADTAVNAPTVVKLPGSTATLINFDGLPCGSGTEPIIYAFTVSCNTVFGGLGMKIGGAALHDQANKFGMNSPNLTIPLPVSPSDVPL